jgi:hypothetical protein
MEFGTVMLYYLEQTPVPAPGPNIPFVVLTSINAVVSLFVLALAIQSLLRVKKIFGYSDKMMIFSLFSIIASISCLIIYNILGVIQ